MKRFQLFLMVATIAASIFLSWISPDLRLMSGAIAQTAPRCNPLGRIVAGAGENRSQRKPIESGQIICSGDQLSRVSAVQMLCFQNRSVITLQGSAVVDRQTCGSGGLMVTQPCQPGQSTQCFRPKGSDGEDFQILQPTTTSVNDLRPRIAWQSYDNATRYLVRVIGPAVSWERQVTGTELSYPPEEPALVPGNAYRILVLVRRDQQSVGSSQAVINIQSAQQITASPIR